MKKFWFVIIVLMLALSPAVRPAAAAAQTAAPGLSVAPIIQGDAANVIAGRYIVVFKPGVGEAAVDKAIAHVRSLNATIYYRYGAALVGFAAALSDQAVSALAKNPNVDYIEADQRITIDTTQNNATWGLDRVDQHNLPLSTTYNYDFTGAGVTVYIIDTGLTFGHPDFSGRATLGTDTVGDGRNGVDCNGHGTHVAGTVGGETYGIAKDVALVAVRVLNCQGSGTNSGVIAGVDWVTANHANKSVANMSLGGSASNSLDQAVANSINAGVTYAIAAGNSNRDACRYSPARVPAAITVGATTSTDSRASYSNYGSCLDLFAPGSSITSDWLNNGTNTISGTSMATPHVAGVAALYLETHTATPAQVATAITSNATSGVVSNRGRNSPNLLLYSLIP